MGDRGAIESTPRAVIVDELVVIEPDDGFSREDVADAILGMLDAAGFEVVSKVPDAALWIDPARCFGKPCITGTRIYTTMVAEGLIGGHYTVDGFIDAYAIPGDEYEARRSVLAAVWWQLTFDGHVDRRTRLGKWRHDAGEVMWHHGSRPELPPPPPHVEGYEAAYPGDRRMLPARPVGGDRS